MRYHRLTREERYQIAALVQSGMSLRQAAIQLGRSPSTISREIKRNYSRKIGYRAEIAHAATLRRRQVIHPPFRLHGPLELMVRGLLARQWSPEQISGRLRLNEGIKISHETIYQYVFRRGKQGDLIFKNLRRKKRFRRSHKMRRAFKRCGLRLKYPSINTRPAVVDQRQRLGDFERDTIIGAGMHKGHVLLTVVDRFSRKTNISKMPKVDANITLHTTLRILRGRQVHTMINDNGPEFAEYLRTADTLNANVYFNDPCAS